MVGANLSNKVFQEAITNIISNELANQVAENTTEYSNSTFVKQTNTQSANCKNVFIDNENIKYIASSEVFMDQTVYQSAINSIVNEIAAAVQNEVDGLGLGTGEANDIKEIISTTVQSILTAEQLNFQNNSVGDTTIVDQECTGTYKGYNVYIGTKDDIYTVFYKSYTSQASVQQTSTTISNIMDAQASNKKIGIFQLIVEMLGLLLIVIVICVAVGVTVYLITISKA